MAILIKSYTEDLVMAAKDFNLRLAAGGAPREFQFPEHHVPSWLPRVGGRKIFQEYFLALENGSVRGGYILKHQDFSFRGENRPLAYYHLPVSEGIVNRAYVNVGARMLMEAVKKHPLLYALGMGGFENPLPKMLKAMGWSMCSVPFYFKVIQPRRFLKGMPFLRKTRRQRGLMDLAVFTGGGWVALKILQKLHSKHGRVRDSVTVEMVSDFGPWADELWNGCKDSYAMIAVRDSMTLRILYPSSNGRFLHLRITNRAGHTMGWAVLLDTAMSGDKYFGDLRVGSVVDCLARPEHAHAVVGAAAGVLENRGVDLIVSNQSHAAWSSGLKGAGFLQGPSNFVFAASRALSALLNPFETTRLEMHLNRGDGDGPLHL